MIEAVVALLVDRGVRFALGGATAMAEHGVLRATLDIDLLTADPAALDPATWATLGAGVEIFLGDALDPLAGVVRVVTEPYPPVDVVVFGPNGWQREVIERATGAPIPILSLPDLIATKLYAGGPRDGWDILALLDATDDEPAARRAVGALCDRLPGRSQRLWRRILQDRDA